MIFSWGPFRLPGYALMVGLGGIVVFRLLYPRKKEIGLRDDEQYWLYINIVLISGPGSARILYLFEYTKAFSPEFWRQLFSPADGFSMFGSFIGMPLAFYAFARWYKIPFMRLFDGTCLMACVWHAFGRIGCLLAGCCHGSPTTLPWGIVFTNPRSMVPPEWLGVPLHPTQLIEAAGDVVLAFFLNRAFKREAGSGLTAALYFGCYCALRFAVEFLRCDTVPLALGLTAGQALGLGLIAAAGAMLVWRSRHHQPASH